jgi:hypothetical protein
VSPPDEAADWVLVAAESGCAVYEYAGPADEVAPCGDLCAALASAGYAPRRVSGDGPRMQFTRL